MKGATLLFLAGHAALAALPLRLVSVERPGLPPYEGTERVYRLEGPACGTLRVGERLSLRRPGEPRSPGQLEILAVQPDHADARLSLSGEVFPLKGDLAFRAEPLSALPRIPAAPLQPLPPEGTVRPAASPRPLPVFPVPPAVRRAPIYFVKEDATLSPGAFSKLKLWTGTWGTGGRWSLECPQAASSLTSLRVSALRSELQRLGVPSLEVTAVPEEPPSRYDAIYVTRIP